MEMSELRRRDNEPLRKQHFRIVHLLERLEPGIMIAIQSLCLATIWIAINVLWKASLGIYAEDHELSAKKKNHDNR